MKLQVGVKVLIENNDGKLLLLERAGKMPSDGGYYWDIPGGRINEQEALMEALSREVMEETGLKLGDTSKLVMAQDIFVNAADLHVVRLTYLGSGSGEVTLSSEHQAYKWVTREELLAERIDPYLRTMMEQNERI